MRFETARTGRQGHPDSQTDALARGLGVFSIALGLAEVFAARSITRALGHGGPRAARRRPTACGRSPPGIGILASRDPTPWIWGRVAGDALDIATLARRARRDQPEARQCRHRARRRRRARPRSTCYCAQAPERGRRRSRCRRCATIATAAASRARRRPCAGRRAISRCRATSARRRRCGPIRTLRAATVATSRDIPPARTVEPMAAAARYS